MKTEIISYNVNGIRAAMSKGFNLWLQERSPEILCLQEIKAESEQINNKLFERLGYNIIINSAEKKGYSGVMILTKAVPRYIEKGIGNEKFDLEGRVIRADFEHYSLLNAYIPSGTTGDVRQEFKMEFLNDFYKYVHTLLNKKQNILICGDFNICHKPIDINHPEKHAKSSGFLPEERSWFDGFINLGFVDTYRIFHSEPNQYSWWSYRANSREKNLGWRIDYHLVSNSLKGKVENATIYQEVRHSDHCPVSVVLNV